VTPTVRAGSVVLLAIIDGALPAGEWGALERILANAIGEAEKDERNGCAALAVERL